MTVRFFDPGREYLSRKDEMDAEIQRVLAAGDLILRKDLEQFEESFAEYVGTKYAIGVASGTDALMLSLAYYKIGPEHVVLAPSYTFRATAETALRTGATVELYDINEMPTDEDFENVDVWMPAYIAGEVPVWAEERIEYARRKGIIVIEDAAQAIGAAPVTGNTACYSFYPAKILGCYGDGGAIATNDDVAAMWFRSARNHFKDNWGYPGYNSRLDNLQAAVLNVKMRHLQTDIKRRLEIARMYDEGLTTVVKPAPRSVYQDYIIEYHNVPRLMKDLKAVGIETMANGYPFPAVVKKGPQTVHYEEHSLRIPCNPVLSDEEVAYVIAMVNKYAV